MRKKTNSNDQSIMGSSSTHTRLQTVAPNSSSGSQETDYAYEIDGDLMGLSLHEKTTMKYKCKKFSFTLLMDIITLLYLLFIYSITDFQLFFDIHNAFANSISLFFTNLNFDSTKLLGDEIGNLHKFHFGFVIIIDIILFIAISRTLYLYGKAMIKNLYKLFLSMIEICNVILIVLFDSEELNFKDIIFISIPILIIVIFNSILLFLNFIGNEYKIFVNNSDLIKDLKTFSTNYTAFCIIILILTLITVIRLLSKFFTFFPSICQNLKKIFKFVFVTILYKIIFVKILLNYFEIHNIILLYYFIMIILN